MGSTIGTTPNSVVNQLQKLHGSGHGDEVARLGRKGDIKSGQASGSLGGKLVSLVDGKAQLNQKTLQTANDLTRWVNSEFQGKTLSERGVSHLNNDLSGIAKISENNTFQGVNTDSLTVDQAIDLVTTLDCDRGPEAEPNAPSVKEDLYVSKAAILQAKRNNKSSTSHHTSQSEVLNKEKQDRASKADVQGKEDVDGNSEAELKVSVANIMAQSGSVVEAMQSCAVSEGYYNEFLMLSEQLNLADAKELLKFTTARGGEWTGFSMILKQQIRALGGP